MRNNYRKTEFLCPECLSRLKAGKGLAKECSGDKLKYWISKFKKYQVLNSKEKAAYLETISDKTKYLELYSKWLAKGKLECHYSNRIYDIIPNDYVLIPDPIFLKKVEKDIGEIDRESLTEETVFYFDGMKYYKHKAKDRKEVKLAWVKFPEDCN